MLDRWLGVIGLAVAILGIPISVLISRHYYRRAEKIRVPTFVIKNRWSLSDPGLTKNVAGLVLMSNGQNVGKEGISQAKIHFWNSGSQAITRDDVLEPYSISLPIPILSFWANKVSREVTQLELQRDTANRLILRFALLEPGDGGTFTIVFDGPKESPIDFNGVCFECPKPTVVAPHESLSLPKSRRMLQQVYLPILSLPLILAGIGLLMLVVIAGPVYGISKLLHKLFEPKLADEVGQWLAVGAFIAFMLFGLLSSFWPSIRRINSPYLPPDIDG